jgi:hypothetical protein
LEGQEIFADKLVKEKEVVEYILPTKEGQDITITFDYKFDCSDCPMDTIIFDFPNRARPFTGEQVYHLASEEG